MKDFLLLVNAVKASSFTSVKKKNNGKVVKPHTITLALVLSSLFLNLAFGFEFLTSIMQLKEYQLTLSDIGSFLQTNLTAYMMLGFFLSMVYSISVFFKGNNNVFLSLPISGNKFFLAKLVLSLFLNCTYGGLTLLIVGLITAVAFKLSALSYLYIFLIFITYVIATPCLSFIVVSFFAKFINFQSNTATTIFTIICSIFGLFSLMLINMASNFTIKEDAESIKAYIANSDIFYVNWISFIPYKLIVLDSPIDNIYVLALIGITAIICLFSLLVSKRSYLKLLGANISSSKEKKTKKKSLDKSYTLLNNPKKLFLKREFSNYKKDVTILIRSFFLPIFMSVVILITLYTLKIADTFSSDYVLVSQILAIIFLCSCSSYYIMPYTSISLEQKNFVMLKTLPLKLEDLLKIKILPSLLIFVPLNLVLSVIYLFSATTITVSYVIALLLIALLFPVCNILFDFLMGIVFVDFNYDNAATLLTKGWGVALCNIFQYVMVGIISLIYALSIVFTSSLLIGIIASSIVLVGVIVALIFSILAALNKLIKQDINY